MFANSNKKVCVLNFASFVTPGGGVVHGASAQEECLCRCSTLYPCLCDENLLYKFYLPHRHIVNDVFYNDDCIYTPDIVVFKSDIQFPELLPENEWYKVDVLTCAAPNINEVYNPNCPKVSDEKIYAIQIKRIEQIFKVSICNGVDVLILGAFGCGAFRNPPKVVAKAFLDVQQKYESYFETIEYAIYTPQICTENYDVFKEQFKNYC